MMDDSRSNTENGPAAPQLPRVVHAWLAPGQPQVFRLGGVEIVVRLVERRGRRARVAVEAAVSPVVFERQS